MPNYYLGIDIGGTKSHALIADDDGNVLGFGSGGAGNHESVGYGGLQATLHQIVGQALSSANLRIEQISGAGFGVAGYDWPSELPPTLEVIDTLNLNAPIGVTNDTIIGLLAGASEGWGVVVVAGTSNNCRGWNQDRLEGRITGNGPSMGEYGGAGELVSKAVKAISAEWTMRGNPTTLTSTFIELAGAKSLPDLLEGLALEHYQGDAEWARFIFRDAIEKHDQVAKEVIAWAGCELGSLAVGVIRQLKFEDQEFEVVLVGSLFTGGELLLVPFKETVLKVAPGAKFVHLSAPPVVGGVLLAMEQARFNGYHLRKRLIEATSTFLAEQTAILPDSDVLAG